MEIDTIKSSQASLPLLSSIVYRGRPQLTPVTKNQSGFDFYSLISKKKKRKILHIIAKCNNLIIEDLFHIC